MKKMNFISATLLALSSVFISCREEIKYDSPKQLITTDLGKDLNARYISERSGIISQNIHRDDANAVWYSLEELQNYINYVKCEGEKQKLNVSGIRFYFGVYPNDTTTYHHKAGLTTIFLSPTIARMNNDVSLKSGAKVNNLVQDDSDSNVDAPSIQPLNYGGIGHPPKVEYPVEE